VTQPERPPQPYARVAGAAYALVIVIGVLQSSGIDSRIVVAADDAQTMQNILSHPTLFRVGIAATLVLYALVVVLAWALYEVLKAVEPKLARLALLFRLAEAVVGVSTLTASVLVADLAASPQRIAALGPSQVEALVGAMLRARTSSMDLVLVLVGVGGAIFCGLLFSARLVPRWLAAWGVVTYLSMLVLALVSLLWSGHPSVLEVAFYGPGALFELTIGLWLLVKGVDEDQWRAVAGREPRAGAA